MNLDLEGHQDHPDHQDQLALLDPQDPRDPEEGLVLEDRLDLLVSISLINDNLCTHLQELLSLNDDRRSCYTLLFLIVRSIGMNRFSLLPALNYIDFIYTSIQV